MAKNDIAEFSTQLGDKRIDAFDVQPGIFEWDTWRLDATATMAATFELFAVPQKRAGSGFTTVKDWGNTSMFKEHEFRYPFSIRAIHVQAFYYGTNAARQDSLIYLLHWFRNSTLEIQKSGQIVFPQFPISRLPASRGIMPIVSAGGTQIGYCSNGMIGVNDYQSLPVEIAFGKGQRINVYLRRNANNATLAAAAPGVTTNYYYFQVAFRGNRIRYPQ